MLVLGEQIIPLILHNLQKKIVIEVKQGDS